MKRRIYVMDCGEFVKIGVSIHPSKRKNQIPYKVKQYYCSEPIENPFDVEKRIHYYFSDKRNKKAFGREYFDVSFWEAVKALTKILSSQRIDSDEKETNNLKILLFGTDEEKEVQEKIEQRLKKCICYMSDFDIGYFAAKYCDL